MQILRQVKKYFPGNPLKTKTIFGQAWLVMVVGSGILGTTLILGQSVFIREPITQTVQLSLTSLIFGLGILLGAIATRFISQRKVNPELETHSEIDPQLWTTPPQCQPFIQERDRFFSLSLDLLCITSFEGYFKRVNAAFVTTLGYTEAELLSVPLWEFVHPDDQGATKAELAKLAQGKPSFNFENRYRCRDGDYRWLSWTSAPFLQEGLLYAVARDVTEYKRSVAQLQSQIAQQATVAELGQYALSQTNVDQLLTEIATLIAQTLNVHFVKILELLPNGSALLLKAGVGWSSGLVGYAHISTASHSHAGYTLAQKQPVVVEDLRVETRFKGEPLLHNHRIVSGISVIIGEEDEPYGVLSIYSRTQRRFSGDDIHFIQAIANIIATAIARQQSTESLYLMERAINASSNGIIITDATEIDNPIIYVNAGFERITGYSKEEVIEQNCRFLQGLQTDSSQVKRLRTALLQGRECRVVIQNYRKDGCLFWNDLQIAPVFNDRGHLTHFIGIQNDITERYEAQEEVRQTRNFLQTMIDHLPVAVFVKEAYQEKLGRFRLWNKACEQLFGLSAKQVLGKTVYEVFPSEQAEFFHQQDQAVLEAGTVLDIPEERVETQTLGQRILHTVKVPLLNHYPDTEYLLCIGEDITQRKQAEDQLRHHAFYDTLTNLPNRALFLNRLAHSIKQVQQTSGELFAVLFLDLDNFKRVNDSLGHQIGDQLLIAIARRLEGCLRSRDTLARLGGDEFTILLEQIKGVTDAIKVARHLHQQLMLPFNLSGNEVFTNVSIGIALSCSRHEQHPEDLLRNADLAMYRAKEMGKGAYAVFDTRMHRQAVERLQLESQLRRALELNEFQVYYQPIVSIITGEVVGFEALIRWLNPYKGFISPALFIPIAEEMGLIGKIGQWVLGSACEQLQVWRKQFPLLKNMTMSVNLSSQQLREPDLLEQIDQVLATTGLPSHCLKLEITESLLIDNYDQALKILRQIQARNIHLSLDDFGTGYSSLSYLHRFPINTLKIDRSFVKRIKQNHDNTAIIKAILRLANALEMNTIAEGIETVFQLDKLKGLGCEYGQGNLFSKALDAKNITHLLSIIQRSLSEANSAH